MTEEFDEDVVFENSPLLQYLHDLGQHEYHCSKEETSVAQTLLPWLMETY
uniref:Uncharacterized protein n=1 Tax=Monopterus albus TaxID=43700 RepID=A0A3Q3K9H4_MONAL